MLKHLRNLVRGGGKGGGGGRSDSGGGEVAGLLYGGFWMWTVERRGMKMKIRKM